MPSIFDIPFKVKTPLSRKLQQVQRDLVNTMAITDGIFAINKPRGMSSAQVIRDCQSYFNPSTMFSSVIAEETERLKSRKNRRKWKHEAQVKIGHGGTLDPLASGVLVLGVGSGTKDLHAYLEGTKTYETVVVFGASTDTYDRVGKLLKKAPYTHITKSMVKKALEGFRGSLKQTPPIYSALKMDGKPLYEYAREGLPIPRDIPTRSVEVKNIELVEWYEPGTHNHRWPAEQASAEEQRLADKIDAALHKNSPTKKEQIDTSSTTLEPEPGGKRKADDTGDQVCDSSPKRTKTEPLPVMSGALPPNVSGTSPAVNSTVTGNEIPVSNPEAPVLSRPPKGKGSDLLPSSPGPDDPMPWDDIGPPAAKIRMEVTSGFYVRSFAHDLGKEVGSLAMMAELVRTRQARFKLGERTCFEYDDLMKGENVWAPKIQELLREWQAFRHRRSTGIFGSGKKEQRDKELEKLSSSPAGRRSLGSPGAPPISGSPKSPDPRSPSRQMAGTSRGERSPPRTYNKSHRSESPAEKKRSPSPKRGSPAR